MCGKHWPPAQCGIHFCELLSQSRKKQIEGLSRLELRKG